MKKSRPEPQVVRYDVFPPQALELSKVSFEKRGQCFFEALAWFDRKGAEILKNEENEENQDALDLWGYAGYLAKILGGWSDRYPPEIEVFLREELAGLVDEDATNRISASALSRCMEAAELALGVCLAATELGIQGDLMDLLRGKEAKEATKKGHAGRYGTEEQKAARWERFQKMLDAVREDFPDASAAEIIRTGSARLKEDGEKFCSESTLRSLVYERKKLRIRPKK